MGDPMPPMVPPRSPVRTMPLMVKKFNRSETALGRDWCAVLAYAPPIEECLLLRGRNRFPGETGGKLRAFFIVEIWLSLGGERSLP